MADSSLFSRLKRLFSTDVIIRNVGGQQLKVLDTAHIQADGNIKTNRRIDRFSRLFATTPAFSHHAGQIQLYTRLELFKDYEAMDTDSILASALDIYADECLHGDTMVPLLDGRKMTIRDLYEQNEQDFWLYGLAADNTFKPSQAKRVVHNGKKQVYAITLDDGTVMRCTSNHVWITPEGVEVETVKLQVGDSILALPTRLSTNPKIKGYEQIWNKGQYEYTHRLVAAKTDRLLAEKDRLTTNSEGEPLVIHHNSFDKLNNDPTKLQWMTWSDHNKVYAEFNRNLWSNREANAEILASYQEKHKRGEELAQSSNHRVISIQAEGLADVYDIVNAGDNHLFAVEAADGSKLYTHNCTVQNEFGDVISISTTNEKVHKVLHNLFYDILNVEFNLWPWIRNTLKYGDFFLKLNVAEKFGVIGVEPISAYEMIREEAFDPENPERVRFRRDTTSVSAKYSAGSNSRDAEEFENYEIAHFRLLTDTNFLPYGRSIVEPARKVWKQLTLMEDAMLIHRIMRAPDKRLFKIDIGNIPPHEVDTFMESVVAKMKKVPYIDPVTGDYNLKYNMQNILEDFYMPQRGAESGTTIENVSGLQSDAIQDIEYLRNRMLASLKIPKAYIGYEEDTSGKSTLASQDFRFARTVERIQRIITSELYKIAVVHLYAQGFTDAELVDFSLSLTAPSTVYEKEKIELWQSKVTLAGDMLEKKLFSRYWIYREVFKMHEEEFLEEQNKIIADAKDQFRIEQIKTEGNDPVKTKQSFGTPHDLATLYKGGGTVPKGYDEREQPPAGGWPGSGRPEEPGTYGTHAHPLGWDPLGNKGNRKIHESNRSLKFKSTIKSMDKLSALKETFKPEQETSDDATMLDENNLLAED